VRTIHKYPLSLDQWQRVTMPVGAKILTAQIQGTRLCVWAEVETTAPTDDRFFFIAGTGHPLPFGPDDLEYNSTVQDFGLVWHVYTRRAP
jgi:hypothetical protein